MDRGVGASASAKPGPATVALAGVDAEAAAILQDCFRQYGVHTVRFAAPTARLARESFAGYVVPLDDQARRTLAAIRRAPDSVHAVVYGICENLQQAIPYVSHGINALFVRPLERQAALNVVRDTYLLVLGQLRRYVRIPLVSAAVLQMGSQIVHASTVEISFGGAALCTKAELSVPQSLRVTVQLPRAGEVSLDAVVCWIRREDNLAGVRFEPRDKRRQQVRQWIDDYLGDN